MSYHWNGPPPPGQILGQSCWTAANKNHQHHHQQSQKQQQCQVLNLSCSPLTLSISNSIISIITYNKISNKSAGWSFLTHLLLWDWGKAVELWIASWPQHHQEAKEPLTFSFFSCLFIFSDQLSQKIFMRQHATQSNVGSDWLTEFICIFVPLISSVYLSCSLPGSGSSIVICLVTSTSMENISKSLY